jgi:RND family efflux transporter MFP subunit
LVEAQAAEWRLRHLLKNGNTTKANYDVATKNLRSAEAKLDAAKAAMKLANDQIAYCQLRADFDGIVTATSAESGQVVNAGQTVLRLARPGDKDAVFAIAESAFSNRYDQDARPQIVVRLLSNSGISAEGEVREISPVADATTRTFLVKATLKSPPEQMRFGGSIVGRLKASTEAVIALPGAALFDKGGAPAVWVVDPVAWTVSLKPVQVGRYETDRVIISGGLAQGDRVVTAGINRLRENQKVALAEGQPQ